VLVADAPSHVAAAEALGLRGIRCSGPGDLHAALQIQPGHQAPAAVADDDTSTGTGIPQRAIRGTTGPVRTGTS
jgi:hypothetical protein